MTTNNNQLTSQEEAKRSLSADVENVNEQQDVAPVVNENSNKMEEDMTNPVISGEQANASVENDSEDMEKKWEKLPAKDKELMLLTLYSLLDLEKKGFVFCRIKINRDVYAKHVKALEKSIEELKGAIVPITFLPASELLKSGIVVVDMNGKEISKDASNLERYLVVIDGQHRTAAWYNLRRQGKIYNVYGMLPMVQDDVIELLKHTNTLSQGWNSLDYTTQTIQTMTDLGIDTSAIRWYKVVARKDSTSFSSASLWAASKIVSKADIKKAINLANTDNSVLEHLFDNDFLVQRQKLYNATTQKLSEKIAGLKVVPQELFSILDKMNKAKKYDKVSTSDKYANLVNFINGLTADSVKIIKEAKNNKATKRTKDSIIATEIQKAWSEYEKNH